LWGWARRLCLFLWLIAGWGLLDIQQENAIREPRGQAAPAAKRAGHRTNRAGAAAQARPAAGAGQGAAAGATRARQPQNR